MMTPSVEVPSDALIENDPPDEPPPLPLDAVPMPLVALAPELSHATIQ
jgi:hypothetical protein